MFSRGGLFQPPPHVKSTKKYLMSSRVKLEGGILLWIMMTLNILYWGLWIWMVRYGSQLSYVTLHAPIELLYISIVIDLWSSVIIPITQYNTKLLSQGVGKNTINQSGCHHMRHYLYQMMPMKEEHRSMFTGELQIHWMKTEMTFSSKTTFVKM